MLSTEVRWALQSSVRFGPSVPSVTIQPGHWLARKADPELTLPLTLISLASPPSWKGMRGVGDLSGAPLVASLHICDLDKFLGHIRFVLGLGIVLSKLHSGRQLEEKTRGKQSGKSVFP